MDNVSNKIYEKSADIPINQHAYKLQPTNGQHSLKQNYFDPSKSSPPNVFIIKLHQRLSSYNHVNVNLDNCKSA
jgi:hypothetical protein